MNHVWLQKKKQKKKEKKGPVRNRNLEQVKRQ